MLCPHIWNLLPKDNLLKEKKKKLRILNFESFGPISFLPVVKTKSHTEITMLHVHTHFSLPASVCIVVIDESYMECRKTPMWCSHSFVFSTHVQHVEDKTAEAGLPPLNVLLILFFLPSGLDKRLGR